MEAALLTEKSSTEATTTQLQQHKDKFKPYRYEPVKYIQDFLGWQPWQGTPDNPGQVEVLEAYATALRLQHERRDYELQDIEPPNWTVGSVIKNRIRIEAGHTVGKTKLASGIVSHFFDCFFPSIVYCFAPSAPQINDLLFKEIRTDRRNNQSLPGRVLEVPEVKGLAANHFIKGRATNNSHGRGTERVQGQHEKYMLFVIDEAEGVQDFVWGAVDSMASGGIPIVLSLANPKTRTSKFHQQKNDPLTSNFRISCLSHPNVIQNKEVVPGAVKRDYVTTMLEKHCSVVEEHDHDNATFTVPWSEKIYLPNNEFMFRVLGKAPNNATIDTVVPVGRYEAAIKRDEPTHTVPQDFTHASIGVDMARFGNDVGTVYCKAFGKLWRDAECRKKDGKYYLNKVLELCRRLKKKKIQHVSIRVDGGGGYGGGLIDDLNISSELKGMFASVEVHEIHFNGSNCDQTKYKNVITEMYFDAAETLKRIAIVGHVPTRLQNDLTDRRYKFVNVKGVDVKQLESKDKFKDRFNYSPDDGDGAVLAASLFAPSTGTYTFDW